MKNKRRTQEEWLALYSEWRNSEENQVEFCVSRGISYRTFQNQTFYARSHKKAVENLAKKESADAAE